MKEFLLMWVDVLRKKSLSVLAARCSWETSWWRDVCSGGTRGISSLWWSSALSFYPTWLHLTVNRPMLFHFNKCIYLTVSNFYESQNSSCSPPFIESTSNANNCRKNAKLYHFIENKKDVEVLFGIQCHTKNSLIHGKPKNNLSKKNNRSSLGFESFN